MHRIGGNSFTGGVDGLATFVSTTRPPPPLMPQALESLLSKLHDELVCLADGLRRPSVAGGLMLGAWQAAVGCVSALALHQVPGWRPLAEVEADLLREFLISLQDLFGEVVDEVLRPRARQEAAERPERPQPIRASNSRQQLQNGSSVHGGDKAEGAGVTIIPAELADADARAAGTAYTSSLLQCVAAATEDLCDMYNAQVSCLQQLDDTVDEGARPEDWGAGWLKSWKGWTCAIGVSCVDRRVACNYFSRIPHRPLHPPTPASRRWSTPPPGHAAGHPAHAAPAAPLRPRRTDLCD